MLLTVGFLPCLVVTLQALAEQQKAQQLAQQQQAGAPQVAAAPGQAQTPAAGQAQVAQAAAVAGAAAVPNAAVMVSSNPLLVPLDTHSPVRNLSAPSHGRLGKQLF